MTIRKEGRKEGMNNGGMNGTGGIGLIGSGDQWLAHGHG